MFKHRYNSAVDAVVEFSARRVEANSQDAEAAQGFGPFPPLFAHGTPRRQAHLDGANQFGRVIRVDLFCGAAVETAQHSMKIRRAFPFCPPTQPNAKLFGALGAGKKSVEQRPQRESRAPDHDRQRAADCNFLQDSASLPRVLTRSGMGRGVDCVEQLMWSACLVFSSWLAA